MQRKRDKIEKALQDKGFKSREGGKHHRYYDFYDGKTFTGIYTYTSTGTNYKDYGNPLLGSMAKQLKLKKSELCDLIDCPMDEEGYRSKLQQQGF